MNGNSLYKRNVFASGACNFCVFRELALSTKKKYILALKSLKTFFLSHYYPLILMLVPRDKKQDSELKIYSLFLHNSIIQMLYTLCKNWGGGIAI